MNNAPPLVSIVPSADSYGRRRHTNVTIEWQGQTYGTLLNYHVANDLKNIAFQAEQFLLRRYGRFYVA